MKKFLLILLPLLPVLLTACNSQSGQSSSMEAQLPIIRTYEVPGGNAQRISELLNGVLNESGGSARVLSSEVVVVSASPAVQAGVQRVIDQLDSESASEVPRIRLHYWLVSATPAETVVMGSNLEPVREALLDTAQATGPMEFSRVDYVQHTLRSGTRGAVGGSRLQGEANVAVFGQRISADLELVSPNGGSVRASVDLDNEETILLAQVGSRQGEGEMLLYVIRAEVF